MFQLQSLNTLFFEAVRFSKCTPLKHLPAFTNPTSTLFSQCVMSLPIKMASAISTKLYHISGISEPHFTEAGDTVGCKQSGYVIKLKLHFNTKTTEVHVSFAAETLTPFHKL